ncbi:MAG TPA: C39 family peptidase [Ktedonobacterales bacterium]|nr:C39 family peptidase [Ktedonobacterales bacterium]
MRQQSASHHDHDALHYSPDSLASNPSSGHLHAPARKVAPRLSLPQRSAIVETTLVEDFAEEALPQPATNHQHAKKRSSQALAVHTAETSPLELPAPVSPADLQLIPRTLPAVPGAGIKQSWFHKSSPRATIIKLMLIGVVVFSVLGATFATAGGGSFNALFRSLANVIPFSAPAQSGATTVAQRVQPIIQADINAGYDSRAQHDLWWDSACSAAAMTEILHAWGIKDVTIGQLIDVMYAHNPPYITPWGGLMSQNAWNFIMSSYRMQAIVQINHSMSYDDVVRMTEVQGIPVVLGIRDSGGRYYPAFGVGHFLVAVGGDSAGLRIVDSSLYRITYLSRDQLNYLWDGLTIVIKG